MIVLTLETLTNDEIDKKDADDDIDTRDEDMTVTTGMMI